MQSYVFLSVKASGPKFLC